MNNRPPPFVWSSPLGISTLLFLGFGVLNVLVGIAGPIVSANSRELPAGILLFSERSDTVVFGGVPSQLVQEHSALDALRLLMFYWLGGMFLAFGVLQVALAWFGLRAGHAWALWALTIGDLATVPYWAAMILVYLRHGAPLGIGDLPPLFAYLAVIPFAAVLGWRGLRGRRSEP